MAPMEDLNRRSGIWTARIVPPLLLGATAYASYVVTKLICVDYLLRPRPEMNMAPRTGIAVPVLVFFYLLLLLWVACYVRLLVTVTFNPGYIEHRRNDDESEPSTIKEKKVRPAAARATSTLEQTRLPTIDRKAIARGTIDAPSGLEQFTSKDAYICDPDGLPLWCDTCANWKPDRTHHNSELGRCIARFDHFCPWVGGVVSETSHKFFLQFLMYESLWGILTGAFTLWALFDRRRRLKGAGGDGQWIAAIALAWSLGIGLAGFMCFASFHYAVLNITTNEDRIERTNMVAVRLRPGANSNGLPTISYPLSLTDSSPRCTYAIMTAHARYKLWKLGPMQNLKAVLGNHLADWILPLRYPPICFHDDPAGHYPFGRDFRLALQDAGLEDKCVYKW